MGIGNFFKDKEKEELRLKVEGSRYRIEELAKQLELSERTNSELTAKLAKQEELLTPEMRDYATLITKMAKKKAEINELDIIETSYKQRLSELQREYISFNEKLDELHKQIIETNDEILVQSFGLYTPRYTCMSAAAYKSRLLQIRAEQKEMVKAKTAVNGSTSWTVDGSQAKGSKMVSDMQKLLLRAFNSECDDVIEHVKYSNIESSEKRITSSRDAISKLGDIMHISISPKYYKLKIEELYLAFEYQLKKQEEKEAQKEARAQLREEAKLAKEIEAQRAKLAKEQTHYQNALKKILIQLKSANESEKTEIEAKKQQIEEQLGAIDQAFKDVDYRAANQKAGYVYIISNIGAFGEGVYKIGMTRRLDPMERVDELGDASVPFNFDVHAMIFSDNAPALEAALHHAFEDRKVNMVNTRREFFRVSLDEIKEVVKKNYDKTVEFYDVPMAEQFRQSELLRSQK